jgi:hypothetical protein
MSDDQSAAGAAVAERKHGARPAAIFLHIPKTAGTTLLEILDRQYAPETIHSFGGDAHASVAAFKRMDVERRAKIRLLRGHMAFGLHAYLPEPTLYFTILRDPVARVISYYRYILRTPPHYLYEEVTQKKMSLGDLLASGLPLMMNDGQVRLISGVWGEPSFGDVTPEMLEMAQRNLREAFVVAGLMEQFDRTLCLLKETLGWTQPITYRRLNVAPQREQKAAITPQTIELIQQANRQDLALYHFAQRLFAEQCARQGPLFEARVRLFQMQNRLRPFGEGLRTYSVRAKIRSLFE